MPDTEISLRVPSHCIRCSETGRIKLQTAIQGNLIELEWCCTACNAEWPVKRRDEEPSVPAPPSV